MKNDITDYVEPSDLRLAMRAVEAQERGETMSEHIVPKPPREVPPLPKEAVMDPPKRFGPVHPAPLPAFLNPRSDVTVRALDRTEEMLTEQGKVHGPWEAQARTCNELKDAAHRGVRWKDCTPMQQEAVDMLLTKISRIVNGNPAHPDHWLDIQGYAKLGGGGFDA